MSTEHVIVTEPPPAPPPEPVPASEPGQDYLAAEAFARSAVEAKAEAEVQAIASAALTTERGIQCAKAHELVDLWFFGEWDEAKFRRWAVLTGSEDPPALGKIIAVMGLLLGGMTPPPPPAREVAEYTPQPTFGVQPPEAPPQY
jgi:hypothetical protein